MENRADGSDWIAHFTRAGAMVLSPERNVDAFAVHAQHRLVRRESERMAGGKRRGRGRKRLRDQRRSRSAGAKSCGIARRETGERLERLYGNWRDCRQTRQRKVTQGSAIAGRRKASAAVH